MRVHDLLRLKTVALFGVDGHIVQNIPDWVIPALKRTPVVVVRRRVPNCDLIPVGVRGDSRDKRFGAFIRSEQIEKCFTPRTLMWDFRPTTVSATGPLSGTGPLKALQLLKQSWKKVALSWGPGGSVGFQLATNTTCITDSSDLDIVIYANERLSQQNLWELFKMMPECDTRVDVQIETPVCGFSLREFTLAHPEPEKDSQPESKTISKPIMLKTMLGPMLGADPWTLDLIPQRETECR